MYSASKFFLIIIVITVLTVQIYAIPLSKVEEFRNEMNLTFRDVKEAERYGGDISTLVSAMNEAIELMKEAQNTGDKELADKAFSKIEKIRNITPNIIEKGSLENEFKFRIIIVTLGVEGFFAVLAYFYIPEIFWKIWRYSKRKMRVKKN